MEFTNSVQGFIHTVPAYRPSPEEIKVKLRKIKTLLKDELNIAIRGFESIGKGMNTSFKIYLENQESPRYQLKILSRKGYPAIEKLLRCQPLLKDVDIEYSSIVYYDDSDAIVPNGLIVQQWLLGNDGTNKDSTLTWLADFVNILQKVHQAKLTYFGTIEQGERATTLQEYYGKLDKVIEGSFGATIVNHNSIWDFAAKKLTSPRFLETTFAKIATLSKRVGPKQPHLCHGDMSAANIIYTPTGTALIDWDEARSHFWPSELARTLFFWQGDSQVLFDTFLHSYQDKNTSLEEIDIIIKLEHIRQLLRYLFMAGFNEVDMATIRAKVRNIEERIERRFNFSYLPKN